MLKGKMVSEVGLVSKNGREAEKGRKGGKFSNFSHFVLDSLSSS